MRGFGIDAAGLKQVVCDWFQSVESASLELPTGWLGRPGDNLHRLTWIEVRGDKLILELDEIVHLILTTPAAVQATGHELRIEGFTQMVLDRRDFGSSAASHAEVFTTGTVRLIAHRTPTYRVGGM